MSEHASGAPVAPHVARRSRQPKSWSPGAQTPQDPTLEVCAQTPQAPTLEMSAQTDQELTPGESVQTCQTRLRRHGFLVQVTLHII